LIKTKIQKVISGFNARNKHDFKKYSIPFYFLRGGTPWFRVEIIDMT